MSQKRTRNQEIREKARRYRMRAKAADEEHRTLAKNILKAELKRHGLTYRELARRLKEMGRDESERNLANKIARGSFSAVFWLECLRVAGSERIEIGGPPAQPAL